MNTSVSVVMTEADMAQFQKTVAVLLNRLTTVAVPRGGRQEATVGDSVDDAGAVCEDEFCLANGLVGEALIIPLANRKNFYQANSDTAAMPRP